MAKSSLECRQCRNVLLLEVVDPRKDAPDYKFQTLYASVKFFGVPAELRSVDMLRFLLNEVGEQSDLERINPNSLFREEKITNKAKDKIRVWNGRDSYILAFVHYEKIRKICTFCAFHNASNCTVRQSKLLLAAAAVDKQLVPFDVCMVLGKRDSRH